MSASVIMCSRLINVPIPIDLLIVLRPGMANHLHQLFIEYPIYWLIIVKVVKTVVRANVPRPGQVETIVREPTHERVRDVAVSIWLQAARCLETICGGLPYPCHVGLMDALRQLLPRHRAGRKVVLPSTSVHDNMSHLWIQSGDMLLHDLMPFTHFPYQLFWTELAVIELVFVNIMKRILR